MRKSNISKEQVIEALKTSKDLTKNGTRGSIQYRIIDDEKTFVVERDKSINWLNECADLSYDRKINNHGKPYIMVFNGKRHVLTIY